MHLPHNLMSFCFLEESLSLPGHQFMGPCKGLRSETKGQGLVLPGQTHLHKSGSLLVEMVEPSHLHRWPGQGHKVYYTP